jgi:hypothetical protein
MNQPESEEATASPPALAAQRVRKSDDSPSMSFPNVEEIDRSTAVGQPAEEPLVRYLARRRYRKATFKPKFPFQKSASA